MKTERQKNIIGEDIEDSNQIFVGVSKSEIDTTQCCICFLNKRSTIDSGIFIDVIFFTENYLNLIIRVATSGLDSVLQQTISVNNEPSGGIMSINGLKRLSQCWQNLEKKWLPAHVWTGDPFTLWQERILFIICFIATFLGPFALIPSIILAVSTGFVNVAVLDCAAYIAAVIVLFSRDTALNIRAVAVFSILYLLGAGLLFFLGPIGTGYIWLLGASIIISSVYDFKALFFIFALNVFTLLVFAFLIYAGMLDWAILAEKALEKWLVMAVNFLLVNALVGITTILMLHSLKETLRNEQNIRAKSQENEQRYRTLFETAKDAIFLMKDDIVIDCNPSSLSMFGCEEKNELLDLHPWALSPLNQSDGQDLKAKSQIFTNAALAGHPQHFEWTYQIRNGTIIETEVVLSRLILNGEFYLQAVLRDVTERKLADDKLRESEARLYAVFNAVKSIPVQGYDRERRVIFWNRASQDVYGYSSEEAHGQKIEDLIIPDDMRQGVIQSIAAWYEEEIVIPAGELLLKDKGGNPVSVFSSHVMIRNINGDKELFCIDVDLSEYKRIEAEKNHVEEQYRQAQKIESIGRLAGGVAHDLNNLLSPILGYSEMLLDEFEIEDERRESVDLIFQAGIRARDLVGQLLAFSRKQTLNVKQIDINTTISGFEQLLRRTIREDIELELILTPANPTVTADIGQIEQVLMNLIVNSADAMPNGGTIVIETAIVDLEDEDYIKLHRGVKPGKYVLVAISDTGCGMDEETSKNIFEPFFSTKGEQGTGLGLATVYGIMKQHDGNIWVYSEPGKGTTFKLYLPLNCTMEVAEKNKDSNTAIMGTRGTETIALVEDNESVRKLAQVLLKQNGYNVLVSENGEDAMNMLNNHEGPVSLMLTDVIMPGINGRDAYQMSRKKHPDLKVLYMSGYTSNVIAHHGVLEQGVQFIQKPFTVLQLLTKVRQVLNQPNTLPRH